MKKEFYTFEEFQEWLINHPEIISGYYHYKHYKEYNDPKLPSNPNIVYKKKHCKIFGNISNSNIEFYTWEEFQEWLKNHPEVVNGTYYHKHYKEYNDSKLSSSLKTYKKKDSEIFGNILKNFYTWEEFQEWLKNHPEVISYNYYKKHYKEYNDSKLSSEPYNTYKKNISEIFGVISSRRVVFYTENEFQLWLKDHPEVVSWVYYNNHYKEYNDSKLSSRPNDVYKKKFLGINFYTYEEFQEWLKNHPEIVGRVYYGKHYKEYNDPKLPSYPNDTYNKKIFGMNFYTWKQFQEWLKNHPVVNYYYYYKNYKEYNDPKLPSDPRSTYNKTDSEVFGIHDKIFYTWEEFQEWLKNHPEVVSVNYYSKHYKEYSDPKLPAYPRRIYNRKIFGNSSTYTLEEKRKIFEERVQISGNDYFILTILYGFEMSFDEEKAKSYYKSIGGNDIHLIKCFNPNYTPKYDGHRFDGFEISELSQLTSADITSILRFDSQRFFNLNKKSLENDDYSCIENLRNDIGGEYFLKFKKMILSYDIQNYKPPTNFKSKKDLTLFQKLTAIDFMR